MKEQVALRKTKNGDSIKHYYYANTSRRYLFRNDELIASGSPMESFDALSLKDDRLLTVSPSIIPGAEDVWRVYRMAWHDNGTWGWSVLPDDEIPRLKAALLLQQ